MARLFQSRGSAPLALVFAAINSEFTFSLLGQPVSTTTHQQRFYETAYNEAAVGDGFPDPHITDGGQLRQQRILTLGGGTGNDLWDLARENVVVNADYAASGLEIGRRFGIQGVLANLNLSPALPFPDGSFDLVVCKDILEHILEPMAVLKEAMRVLRDSGTLVISVPNHFYWPMRLRLLLGKGILWRGLVTDHGAGYREWDYMHIRFFTYKGFREFLRTAGLKPVRFFWDFGNLAYYYNPDRWFAPQLRKRGAGEPLSRRAKFGLNVLMPLWRVFNLIFPKPLRSSMVSLAPGLLCGGFYVRCMKG
jgi:ubiquinone/menaquinone biosynthesis C-methylase UbiE